MKDSLERASCNSYSLAVRFYFDLCKELSDSGLRTKLGRAAAEVVKDCTWSKIAEKHERICSIFVRRRLISERA